MRRPLAFQADETFKIVQFTDLHWKDGRPEDLRTRQLMRTVIETEQPDLVVFTGDVIYTGPVDPGRRRVNTPSRPFVKLYLLWRDVVFRGHLYTVTMIPRIGLPPLV